jgi:RNA polymerase sigma factor (sigma-70 family)
VNNKKEWTMVTDKNFEKALMDSNNQRIMNKVSGKYINSIDYDELESEKLIVLWECLKTYDPERRKKFTSFLYQKLDWRYKKILRERKRRRPLFCDNLDLKNSKDGLDVEKRIVSHTDGLPKHLKNVIVQYYLYNMTIEEIGRENLYSRETARRLIKKALDKIKYVREQN